MTTSEQYLTFDAAGDRFALPIRFVHEIVEYRHPTPVPGTSPFIRGVYNHGGAITAVVDFAQKLGMRPSAVTPRTCIVVVRVNVSGDEVPVGLMVDTVNDVLDIGAADVQPPPEFGTRIRLEYLLGLVRANDAFTIVLDADHFLSAADLLEITHLEPTTDS